MGAREKIIFRDHSAGILNIMKLIIEGRAESRSEENWVVKNETRDQSLARKLKFVNLFPAGAGIFMAAGIFLTQYWKWFQTGEWPGAPMAEFVPQPLIQWATAKEGGLLGLKEFVLASLSIHASVWFFVTGCGCTFLLMEIKHEQYTSRRCQPTSIFEVPRR